MSKQRIPISSFVKSLPTTSYQTSVHSKIFGHLIQYFRIDFQIMIISFCMIFLFGSWSNFESAYASHCIQYVPAIETIALLCGSADLFDILDNLGPNQALVQESNGVWVLNGNLIVGNSATLNINSTYTTWLKINSTDSPNPFHIQVLGNMILDSVKISSWNFKLNNYTAVSSSFPRPYIAILPGATGRTIINDADISFLGYKSPGREGLSFFGGGQNSVTDNKIHDQYYGVFNSTKELTFANNTLYNNVYDINLLNKSNTRITQETPADDVRPFVSIRYPVLNSTLPYNDIIISGTAFDEHSGVSKVEVFEHTFPFNNQFPYKVANPVSNGNWSSWQYHFNVTAPGLHRISARVTDVAGNQNWAETLVKISSQNDTVSEISDRALGKRLAIVNPLFTDAAYNAGGFYEFYPKYDRIPEGTEVKTDLHLLTSQIPDYDMESRTAGILLLDHLRKLTNSTVYSISDEDVHQGYIFNRNGSNAYDVLFFLHDEYATKASYANMKRFVANGGTIVFIDGNVLYGEVVYNPDLHTVSLLQGHDWKFDGSSAEKSVHERWLNENKDWMGSNFLWGPIEAPVVFSNNPFNYTHFEENYVSNPKAHILYDYGAKIPPQILEDNYAESALQIASYSLQYGKGKVIMIGLYGQNLLNNDSFLKFFDNLIFPQAAGKSYFLNNSTLPIDYYLSSGNLSKIELQGPGHLSIELDISKDTSDMLMLSLPIKIISPNATDSFENLLVLVDGMEAGHDIFIGKAELGIKIQLPLQARKVDVKL